jgi:hypothetical protein
MTGTSHQRHKGFIHIRQIPGGLENDTPWS